MKIVLFGGTGLIGRALCREMSGRGHNLVVATRDPARRRPVADEHLVPIQDAHEALAGAEVAVNLAGENIAERAWNRRRMKILTDSRVQTTQDLVSAIEKIEADKRPRLLLNASAIGFYGDRGDEELSESSSAGTGFLSDLCVKWEHAAQRAERLNLDVVRLRIGIVLSREGGALPKMRTPFRLYAGGPLGSGQQWMSWIHVDDICGLIQFLIEKEGGSEPVNLTAPTPLRNADFSRILAKSLNRPSWLPAPSFALRLVLGKMSEMLLGGQKVLPRRAELLGYPFRFPTLEDALKDLLKE